MKKTILIVDSEPKVLNTLSQWLSVSAPEWHVQCATSGTGALQLLAQGRFDAILTDLSLVGMDGIELLGEVRMRYPGMARIIMCKHTERQTLQSAFGLAHQYIFKPCKMERLLDVLRSVVDRNSLGNQQLVTLLGQIQSIPSLPSFYVDLKREIQSENASLHNVAAIIQRDPGMTAKILQLVNSVHYGLAQSVSNIHEAVMHLGIETIQSLVLTLQLFSYFQRTQIQSSQLASLWDHSWRVATLARRMALVTGAKAQMVDDTFTAGILHDLGKLILAGGIPLSYNMMLRKAKAEKISQVEAEKAIFQCSHGEVGGYLLGLWGISNSIVDAVCYHHTPLQASHLDVHPLTFVHVANFLSHLDSSSEFAVINSGVDLDYLATINGLEYLEVWQDTFIEVERRSQKTLDKACQMR